jgi:hypothetical protein
LFNVDQNNLIFSVCLKGELVDNKLISYYDIINKASLIMDTWVIYRNLIKAASFGNFNDLLQEGVSNRVEWHSPTADEMFRMPRAEYIRERGGIALFVAAHRNHTNVVKELISHGANINFKSQYGRTPLMISMFCDKEGSIEEILKHNPETDIEDESGDGAMQIAKRFKNKLGQQRLTQHKWQQRIDKKTITNSKDLEKNTENHSNNNPNNNTSVSSPNFNDSRLPHQVFDSSKKTWLKGNFMQVYMLQLVPLGEYSGSRINAPKSVGVQGSFLITVFISLNV